jgi:4-hydroxy-tetrahydrodipicolinate reductase
MMLRCCNPARHQFSGVSSATKGRLHRNMAVSVHASSPTVMINSCTGKMGQEIAAASLRAGLTLVPFTFCGASEASARETVNVEGRDVKLVGPADRVAVANAVREQYPGVIMVDFTVPAVIHEMTSFYVQNQLPFVMGTTGGDRARLLKEVEDAGLYAVVAPQMGKQVVAFQAGMELMAQNFPGAFTGYKLRVVESHQSSKKDTSGTAKAIVSSFIKLGVDFDVANIELVREPAQQTTTMKVPEEYLAGHAYHTYQLVSSDDTVFFEFQHNVCGRRIYAEGTVDAVLFLARQIENKAGKTLYNMIDVLQAGAMR